MKTTPPGITQLTDLVQAALLICAFSTVIQVTGFRYRQFQIGSGLLSVMGVSFTTVTLYQSSIANMMVGLITLSENHSQFESHSHCSYMITPNVLLSCNYCPSSSSG